MTSPDLVRAIRAALRRLVCFAAGHRTVRTITDIKWDAVAPTGPISGEITGSRYNCIRCGGEVSP